MSDISVRTLINAFSSLKNWGRSRAVCLSSLLLLLIPSLLQANNPDDLKYSVVRIRSHGGSGTVIWTGQGRSYILSCAHIFMDEMGRPSASMRSKPITLDIPAVDVDKQPKKVGVRLVAWDYPADLSLIELNAGPLPYSLPIYWLGDKERVINLQSAGYDQMRLAITAVPAHAFTAMTYTKERPIPGRSGGALIDLDRGCLVGVCHGYEVGYKNRGMYVSLPTVITFLRGNGWNIPGSLKLPQNSVVQKPLPQRNFGTIPNIGNQRCPT